MKIFYSDRIGIPIPEGHRFPRGKQSQLREKITSKSIVHPGDLIPAKPASNEQILLVHTREYLTKVIEGTLSGPEERRLGIPWTPQLVERSRLSVGATIAACQAALIDKVAANLGGGTHHAYPDHGAGYCVFNDVAIAIRVFQKEEKLERAVIVDCDVHQGNGTALIFKEDPNVFTFSIHGMKNYPYHKEKSDLDIALPDGSGDELYLNELKRGINYSLDQGKPDLLVYLAGADPYFDDELGKLSLTKDGLTRRDRMVLERCKLEGLPVAIVLGGGYARNIEDSVDIHLNTVLFAYQLFAAGV